MTTLGFLVDAGPGLEDGEVTACVPLLGRDEADRAVQVRVVVPGDEVGDPLASSGQASERTRGVLGPVLHGSEGGFDERVVIADGRPAEGCGDAKGLQGGEHRAAAHGMTVVGVDDQLTRLDALGSAGCCDQRSRVLVAFAVVHGMSHDLAAEDVEDGVTVEEATAHGRRQVGDVPAPDLIRRRRDQLIGAPVRRRLRATTMSELLLGSKHAVEGAL